MAPSKTSKKWLWIRRSIQILILALFLYLLVANRAGAATWLPDDLFFRLNPLTALSAMISERRWILPLALGFLTIGLTLVLGRVWCGWICPLGTLLGWTNLRRHRNSPSHLPHWRHAKYLTLLAVLLAALLGTLSLLILDPLTIIFRTLTSGIIPGLNWLVTRGETYLYRFDWLQGFLDGFDRLIRGHLLPAAEPYFIPSLLLVTIFIGILALNAIRPRFWCRYICPLGGLLGLMSRVSLLRRAVNPEKCISCRRCARECPLNAIDSEKSYASDPAECTLCLKCFEDCPSRAIVINPQFRPAESELEGLTRRQVLGSLGMVLAGVALMRLAPLLRGSSQRRLRPPGMSEDDVMKKCLRCGVCVNICPTRALHPSGIGADYDSVWTPTLVPRLGYCDYICHRCGQVCPSGAIPSLTLAEKQQTVIGKAEINKDRCLPWAENVNCIVCHEMCPLPEKAIELDDITATNSEGLETVVRRPRVIRSRCIGCGLCEHQCPVNGQAAIRVYPEDGGQHGRRGHL